MSELSETATRAALIINRYRTETPLGHQPHMIAEEASTVEDRLREIIKAEQEPVAWSVGDMEKSFDAWFENELDVNRVDSAYEAGYVDGMKVRSPQLKELRDERIDGGVSYIVIRRGVYIQGLFGSFGLFDDAKERAVALAARDCYDYHEWQVVLVDSNKIPDPASSGYPMHFLQLEDPSIECFSIKRSAAIALLENKNG